MTTKIGLSGSEVTVADPDQREYRVETIILANSQRAGDGTLRTDFTTVKRRWTVPWKGLSAVDYAALWAELMRASHLDFEPPEGGDYVVKVQSASWTAFGAYYNVMAVLEEV